MFHRIIIIFVVMLVNISGVYAMSTLTDTQVETRITEVQGSVVPSGTPAAPTGLDQKGYIGSIIANIFDATQKIKTSFISAFDSILGVTFEDNIPKWNGQSFVLGTMNDVGGNVGVGTSSISTGLKLDVEGKVGATEYCDENGQNCFTATSFPAQWYQANNQECSDFCTSRGLANIGDPANSNTRCTSGENRYAGITNVTYTYGAWGPVNTSPATSVGGMCYRPGQLRDGDGTDITTGCFCSGGTQVGSNQVSGGVGGGSSVWSQSSSGTYILSSDVGIGISNPSVQLHTTEIGRFDGGVQIDGRRAISATGRSHTAQSNLSDYGYFQVKNNAGDTGAYFGAGNGGNRVNLVLSSADRMNISGGNVGIGVNDPGARLHVNGNIIANNPTANNHVATKAYADGLVGGIGGGIPMGAWIDVTSSRSKMTAYQNTNLSGLMVNISSREGGPIEVSEDGINWLRVGLSIDTSHDKTTTSIIVPPNHYYRVGSNNPSITAWTELVLGTTGGSADNLGNHIATQDLDLGNNRIINLAEPTRNANAATKGYVDNLVSTIPNFTAPPTCDGNNKALGWNGTSWVCNTIGGGSGPVTYSWNTGAWGSCQTIPGGNSCIVPKGKTRVVQCISSVGAISQDSFCSGTKPSGIDANACMNDDSNCGP